MQQATSTDYLALEEQYTSGVYGKRDQVIVRGQGTRVWDAQGREYLDCTAGIGVASLGHCHPALVAAITEQAGRLITCQEMFHNDRRAELLARLATIVPAGLERFFLCNSGTEAVEAAIKFAQLSNGRHNVVAAMRGFHGRTLGALSATHKKEYRRSFEPLVPGFTHVPFDKAERLATAINDDTAAVVLEIVQGEGGVRPGRPAFFQAARELCDRHGALLIVDEVQTGFGRTGRWFACEHANIAPDLMTMGKAMAGGVPMGAVAIGARVANLSSGVHGSTFGGNPLACAAALAALEVYESQGLVARAAELGGYLFERLRTIQSPYIREIRGLGLMVGIELRTHVHPVIEALTERGVLALKAGSTVLRLLPPLTISRAELDTAVEALRAALTTLDD